MQGARALLLLLILSAPAVFASLNPELAASAVVNLDENGTVSAIGGQMRDLEINISVPVSSPYQAVQSQSQRKLDKEGNEYVSIISESPENPFRYSERMVVRTVQRSTPELPDSYVVPQDVSRYLSPTSRTESNDPEIRKLALRLTEGASDPFEKVALLAIWVNTNMKYDETLVGQEHSALWALNNRRGVCVEYSTLFIALSRSIGIPARYVTGYVYSEKYGSWLGHAWAEAYVGKWVPVDPTWFEVGTSDALHIEAAKYAELSRESALIASVSPASTQIKWDTSGKSGAFANNIEAQDITLSDPDSDYTLQAAENTLAPGGSTIAFLSMKGRDYRVVRAALAPCTGEESVQTDGSERFLILRPGKTATAAWELRASSGVSKNYIYTCPLTLNSPTLSGKVLEVRVDPRKGALPVYSASLEKSTAAPGAANAALLTLPAERQGKTYYLVTADGVQTAVLSSASARIPFTAGGNGMQKVYIAGEGGGFSLLEYSSGGNSTISIESFSLPPLLVQGQSAQATAAVAVANYPADVDLVLEFEGESIRKSGRISEPASFTFDVVASSAEPGTAVLRAYSGGAVADGKSAQYAAIPQPKLAFNSIKTVVGAGGALVSTLSFSGDGEVYSPAIKIDGGAEYAIGEDWESVISLPAGSHELLVQWSDAAGNNYSASQKISVQKPGVFDDMAAKAVPPVSKPCPVAFVILGMGFAAFAAKR